MLKNMKLLVLYRPNSEHATLTESYLRDFERQNPDVLVEMVDADTREGAAKAAAYAIVDYPALIPAEDDGAPLYIWQGTALPLMNEVASYLYS